MNITHIQLLSIPVTDQDRAKDFYVDVIGFELLRDDPMGPDQRWVQVGPKGAATSITLVTWFETPSSFKGVVLESADVDADCEQLRRAGVAVGGPEDTPWGRQATFDDPDGNGLVLLGRPPA